MIDQNEIIRRTEARMGARKKEREKRKSQIEAMQAGKAFNWNILEEADRLATRAKRMGLASEARELLHDPKNKTVGNKILEKIIGANNLLDTHFLAEGARISRSIGRIVLPVPGGNRLGTGFMISANVMMTNNHVMETELQPLNAVVEFDFVKQEDGTTGPVERFRFRPDALFITDVDLDFTLVAVEPVNSSGAEVQDRGWIPLLGPSGKAVIGERVSIIQHPNGEPQKVAVHDNEVVDLDGPFLQYEADTMGGSSGSPVFNINWDLAALHHAAVGNANQGIRISAIVAFLREMFDQESFGTEMNQNLLAEILSPLPAPIDPTEAQNNRAIVHRRNQAASDPPTMNDDGTASWTIPLNITLGIGQSPIPSAADQPIPSDVIAAPVTRLPNNEDLEEAIRAFEATADRVYYSKSKDEEDRKNYYPCLESLTAAKLYDELSKLVEHTHTTTLSYKKARLSHLYPWIDRREGSNKELRGIYSNKVFDTLEVIRNEIAMERSRETVTERRLESLDPVDDEFLAELEAAHPFNCEHVVPQSWFNKRKQPKTDMHHLFTCEWGCNSFRGNRAYFDFATEAFREDCGESANGKFEPKSGKGAVARATLYFLLRYPGDIANSTKEMPLSRLSTLIEWAQSDKVDRWELHRNAEIYKVQGNRNPLIDFPELVDKIDFSRGWA